MELIALYTVCLMAGVCVQSGLRRSGFCENSSFLSCCMAVEGDENRCQSVHDQMEEMPIPTRGKRITQYDSFGCKVPNYAQIAQEEEGDMNVEDEFLIQEVDAVVVEESKLQAESVDDVFSFPGEESLTGEEIVLKSALKTSPKPKDSNDLRSKTTRFSADVSVGETFHPEEYSRDKVLCSANFLKRPEIAKAVTAELNQAKREMLIHPWSRQNTKFYQ